MSQNFPRARWTESIVDKVVPKPGIISIIMADLERLRRRKISAQGWLTRSVSKIEMAVTTKEIKLVALTDLLADFDKRLVDFDLAEAEYEQELDETDIATAIETAGEVRDKAVLSKLKAVKLLSELKKDSAEAGHELRSESSTPDKVRLPKLQLPKFSGDVLKWPQFWDSFSVTVDASEMSDVTKLTYLRSLLTGEASRCVEGMALCAENYGATCQILKDRFGRREQIVFGHIQALLQVGQCQKQSLKSLQDELLVHVRSLETLNVTGERYGVVLTPILVSRLPEDVRKDWAREGAGKESDLDFLLAFLKKEINSLERSQAFSGLSSCASEQLNPGQRAGRRVRRETSTPSAAALQASSSSSACGFCSGSHPPARCPDLLKLPVGDRPEKIRNSGMCFRCLRMGHKGFSCSARCEHCKGKHHAVSCFKVSAPVSLVSADSSESNRSSRAVGGSSEQQATDVNLSCAEPSSSQGVVLPTASVFVKGQKGTVRATVLLDTGSNRSYVSSSLVHRCAPEWVGSREMSYAAFGGGESGTKHRNIYCVKMSGAHTSQPVEVEVEAAEVPVICAPLVRPAVPQELLTAFGNLELADPPRGGKVSVDILIGLDFYWQVMRNGFLRVDGPGPVAQQTVLGWVLSGPSGGPEGQALMCGTQLLVMTDVSEARLRRFWDLDSVGISDSPFEEDVGKDPVLQGFESSVCFQDGRYVVQLPWKPEKQLSLEDNRRAAEVRLASLDRKLDKDPQLHAAYDRALEELEAEGIITEVSCDEVDGPVFYLPHRPVVRESSATTKVRPVFDASAKGPNGVSLNDCLETGPCLLPDLVEVLMRFRRWRFAVSADIRKAFLMIGLRECDQHVHRFLWHKDDVVRTMSFTRVTFGVKSSPFLLGATLRHHLLSCPPSRAVSELGQNMYVDDLLSGADSEDDALALYSEAKEVLAQAGMELTKVSSNSSVVLDKAAALSGPDDAAECHHVLGVEWKPGEDVFSFAGVCVPEEVTVTKRVILSFIARMFDPLGFLSPYIMTLKLLFQETWRLGLDWDDPVPDEISSRFMTWLNGLRHVKGITVPRSYCCEGWRDVSVLTVHAFGDASEVGYGAAVYLQLKLRDGSVVTPLVIARGRVAPLKRVSLPRLELLGSLMAARLLRFVFRALRLPTETLYQCWTDSMVSLGWIKGDPSRWKQFVRNRVTEIHCLTDPAQWVHCPGSDNPADLITRGVNAKALTESCWFTGPDWLREGDDGADLPLSPGLDVESELSAEADDSSAQVVAAQLAATAVAADSSSESVFEVERFSSLTKAIRVVALVLKFIRLLKERRVSSRSSCDPRALSFVELTEAKMCLIKLTQFQAYPAECRALKQGKPLSGSSRIALLRPFLDEQGLLRVRSRLENTDLTLGDKCPILIPKGHLADLIIRFQHVLLKHAGVDTLLTTLRYEYWIVGARRAAKRMKRACTACRRQDAAALNAPVAPLPALRASKAPPFSVTGVDFCGPLYCLPRQKVYICLFTCAVTRAIHLELVDSLSLSDFLLAFRRFCARRGMPSFMYSDNARTFRSAAASLLSEFGPASPQWKFIAPRAAWWGGWWERLIRTVKSALKKTLGRSVLSRVELETLLHEVEASVNSRPLTFVSDDFDAAHPLTPSHFLSGRVTGARVPVSDDSADVSASSLTERELQRQELLSRFWAVWQADYLKNLPHSVRKFKSRGRLQIGSVVLIREDNVPRLSWLMGVVERLHPSSDGVVRSADVRTVRGVRTRPVQRLHDLEVAD